MAGASVLPPSVAVTTYSVERDLGLCSCKVVQPWELWKHWSPWGIPRSPYRPRGVCGRFLMISSVLILFYPGVVMRIVGS